MVHASVLTYNMHGALWISGGPEPVTLSDNVVFEAYDKSAVQVSSTGNTIRVSQLLQDCRCLSKTAYTT